MDSQEVRRIVLGKHGGLSTKAAPKLAMSRQNVEYHMRQATRKHPLSLRMRLIMPEGTEAADAEAIMAYLYSCLEKVGITRTPEPPAG